MVNVFIPEILECFRSFFSIPKLSSYRYYGVMLSDIIQFYSGARATRNLHLRNPLPSGALLSPLAIYLKQV